MTSRTPGTSSTPHLAANFCALRFNVAGEGLATPSRTVTRMRETSSRRLQVKRAEHDLFQNLVHHGFASPSRRPPRSRRRPLRRPDEA